MAKELENIISELKKGRERSPGRINLTLDPTAVIYTPGIYGLGKKIQKWVQSDKMENPVRNVEE